jgi:hypothetical protein
MARRKRAVEKDGKVKHMKNIEIKPIKLGVLVLVRGLARIGQMFHYTLPVIFSENN